MRNPTDRKPQHQCASCNRPPRLPSRTGSLAALRNQQSLQARIRSTKWTGIALKPGERRAETPLYILHRLFERDLIVGGRMPANHGGDHGVRPLLDPNFQSTNSHAVERL